MRNDPGHHKRGPAKKKARFRYLPKQPATDDDWIGLHRIHAALTTIDTARADLANAHTILKQVIACADKRARRKFERFTMIGGCTAEQFADMIEGLFRGTPTRQRKHLRIVSNNGTQMLPPAA